MKHEHKILLLILLLGIFIWIADALIDFLFFYKGSFWSLLIYDVPIHETYMRLFSFMCFCIFGTVVAQMLAKRKQKASCPF